VRTTRRLGVGLAVAILIDATLVRAVARGGPLPLRRGRSNVPGVALLLATKRVWIPFLVAALCLIAAGWTSPLVSYVLIVAALGGVFDGATVLWSRGANLTEYRQ
jgi:hypothetical protein